MLVEYALKDECGRYIHRDITGKFGYTTSEILADRYDSRKAAKNVLENCLPRAMRKGFDVVEIVVSDKDAPPAPKENKPQVIRPKVDEALRIANQPIVPNNVHDISASFQKVRDILLMAAGRKEELANSLSEVDSEISDINHYIEFADGLNAYQGYLAFRMLRQKLLQRRQIKDELNAISVICDSEISHAEFERVSRRIAGMENRQFMPRVLTELFT